ncbi:MAG: LTA synthase family protein [Muribaculaceae bacterium]
MKQKLLYLFALLLTFLMLFALGKVTFMVYNSDIVPLTFGNVCQVLWHGLTIDMSTAGYLLIVPWLCCLAAIWLRQFALRKVMRPYLILASVLVVAIIVVDICLYSFWKFKINSSIFAYIATPQAITSSISLGFMVARVAIALLLMAGLWWVLERITPRLLHTQRHRMAATALWLLLGGGIFVMIRGGVQESTMNVGVAYYSPNLSLNHAAVNPMFSLMQSMTKSSRYSNQFHYMSQAQCDSIFNELYPEQTDDLTDTLLTTNRPNVLIVFMESFGGTFIKELGGEPNVAPEFSQLIPQGVFWTRYYSTSFRTDRGTVSFFSGHISYPTASLMRMNTHNQTLPGLGNSLTQAGYYTHYLYGGDINIMGKKGYLIRSGYNHLTSDRDFSFAEVNESKWGANDSITCQRTYEMITTQMPTDKPWHLTLLTLSSHEPFDVPYNRLSDKVLNAFAFTDHCVGKLIKRLQQTPLWDNLLVILVPDHGFLHNLTYQDAEYFHCPMLWLGGAVKQPRTINVLTSQSDVVATLLAQMNLPHKQYRWSRNVLSSNYTYPMVYASYPSGIMYADTTGTTVFDISSRKVISETPAPSPQRLLRAKALLQKSYSLLDDMK